MGQTHRMASCSEAITILSLQHSDWQVEGDCMFTDRYSGGLP